MQIFAVRHTEFDTEIATRHHTGLLQPCHPGPGVQSLRKQLCPAWERRQLLLQSWGQREELQQLPEVKGQEKATAHLCCPACTSQ